MKKHFLSLVFILALSIYGLKALIHTGLFTAHDIGHQVARIYYYHQAFHEGQIPPYWVGKLANGYGYPLFIFSYHLPWLVGLPLLQLGLSIENTIKLLFFLSYFGSGIAIYFLANSIFKNRLSGLSSATLYLFAPYHFLTIFVSASMGVVWTFTFLPLILFGLKVLSERRVKLGILLTAVGLAGCLLSHLITVLLLIPLLISFIIWLIINYPGEKFSDRKMFILYIFFSFFLGGLVSAFYLIPALYYSLDIFGKNSQGFSELYLRNFVNLSQLIYSKWGFGPIINNAKEGAISFQIGIIHWLSLIGSIILIFTKKIPKNLKILVFLLILNFALSIFLMIDLSKNVWVVFEKLFILDYPFRLLLLTSFIGSLLGGLITFSISKNYRIFVLAILLLTSLYVNRNHLNVNLYTDYPLSFYLNSDITTNTFNEYLPKDADSKLLKVPHQVIEPDNLKVSNFYQDLNKMTFQLKTEQKTNLSIGQFYFPGQTLYIDNIQYNYLVDKTGRIALSNYLGNHQVKVLFNETLVIKLSKILTIFAVFTLAFLLISGAFL